MEFLVKINCCLNRVLMIAGGVAVLLLMLLATGNVVLRIFQAPYSGAYEIVSFLGALVTAFALGYTHKRKDHIIVDVLTEKFPDEVNRFIDAFADLVIALFFAIVAWQMYLWGMKIAESGEVSETLKMPYHPFVLGVAAGFAALTFTSCVDILQKLFKSRRP
jgi:TRAP-type C4-dicarboxylate transport system permease small subunit